MIIYALLVGIYFLGLLPMQIKELVQLKNQEQIQQKEYEKYEQDKKFYTDIQDYEQLLQLQIRSYEKEFLKYENAYMGTEKLQRFLEKYPVQKLSVVRKDCKERVEDLLTLREEIYHITYKSTFYESYKIIQNLLSVTGDSYIEKILMSNLEESFIQTDLIFVLRLEGELNEKKDTHL